MAELQRPIKVPSSHLNDLRARMRDAQVSIQDYYRETSRTSDESELGTRLRACVSATQIMNVILSHENGAQSGEYKALFMEPVDSGAGLVLGFDYLRAVVQHLLFSVTPRVGAMLGGVATGLRTYATWQEVPSGVHKKLKRSTKDLKPYYDSFLVGKDVTNTFLDAAAFFHRVCPDIVHRDGRGEWTGFPLAHQAGVEQRLHPEEPYDQRTALEWLARRRPGGDCRVIVGNFVGPSGDPVLYGLTFVGRCSFAPFFETVEQIAYDINRGYPYRKPTENVTFVDRGADFGMVGRSVLCADTDVSSWAGVPLDAPANPVNSLLDDVDWEMAWGQEAAYMTRRERRLNASAPEFL